MMTNESKINVVPTLRTVRQMSERHPGFNEGGLRSLIFQSKPRKTSRGTIQGNGMAAGGVLVRLGRKVLIDEVKFFQWLDDQQKA